MVCDVVDDKVESRLVMWTGGVVLWVCSRKHMPGLCKSVVPACATECLWGVTFVVRDAR